MTLDRSARESARSAVRTLQQRKRLLTAASQSPSAGRAGPDSNSPPSSPTPPRPPANSDGSAPPDHVRPRDRIGLPAAVAHVASPGAVADSPSARWKGLSLGYLKRFVTGLQGHTFYEHDPVWGPSRARKIPERAIPLAEVTTQEAVLQYVMPQSLPLNGALSVGAEGTADLAPATVFVSHAWKYSIMDVLEQLIKLGTADPDQFFWLDFLMVDQNKAHELPPHFWTDTLRGAIVDIGRTVLVLSPWNDPIPLTRAWCLYEMFSTLSAPEVRFDIVLPDAELARLRTAVQLDDGHNAVMDAMVEVKAEEAECHDPADQEMIHTAVKSLDGGFHRVNVDVKTKLRCWILDRLKAMVATEGENADSDPILHAALCNNVGYILCDHHKFPAAKAMLQQAVAIRERELGTTHPETAASYHFLGLVYRKMGDNAAAEVEYRKALAIHEAVLGEQHEATAQSCGHLGGVLKALGDYAGALVMYRRGLDIKEVVMGREHPSTAWPHNNIADVLYLLGDYPASLEACRRGLAIRLAALGADHPHTARSHNSVGLVLSAQGEHAASLEQFRRCLRINEAMHGDNHPYTIQTLMSCGRVLLDLGRPSMAVAEYRAALVRQEQSLGADHAHTVATRAAIAAIPA